MRPLTLAAALLSACLLPACLGSTTFRAGAATQFFSVEEGDTVLVEPSAFADTSPVHELTVVPIHPTTGDVRLLVCTSTRAGRSRELTAASAAPCTAITLESLRPTRLADGENPLTVTFHNFDWETRRSYFTVTRH